jgi:type VI secretion system secreted protein VgrG
VNPNTAGGQGTLHIAFELQRTYPPREYCVQYRESDFEFASRLMEEEGIFYFFNHSEGGHQLVLGDTPAAHEDVPGERTLTYDPRANPPPGSPTVGSWTKSQLLRSAKVTLGDHQFELPQDRIEATAPIQESVVAGQVTHQLQVPPTANLELYDYPGRVRSA